MLPGHLSCNMLQSCSRLLSACCRSCSQTVVTCASCLMPSPQLKEEVAKAAMLISNCKAHRPTAHGSNEPRSAANDPDMRQGARQASLERSHRPRLKGEKADSVRCHQKCAWQDKATKFQGRQVCVQREHSSPGQVVQTKFDKGTSSSPPMS